MYKKEDECLKRGCGEQLLAKCAKCGFNPHVAAAREKIPLTLCKDGLCRKILVQHEE